MDLDRAVRRLRLRRGPAVDRQVVRRHDRVVFVHLSDLLEVVAGQRVPEFADRARCVEPALRRAVRTGRRRERQMVVLGGPQRNEVHRTAERVAPLGVGRAQPFGHGHAAESRNRKLREVDVAGVAVVELLTVERNHRFRRIGTAQRNDGRRRRRAGVGPLDDDGRHLPERFEHLRVAQRVHLRARHVHLGDHVAIEREPAVDGHLADRTKLRSVVRLERDVNARSVAQLAGVDGDGGVAARDDGQIVAPGRHLDGEGSAHVGRRGDGLLAAQRHLRVGDRRPAWGVHRAADQATGGNQDWQHGQGWFAPSAAPGLPVRPDVERVVNNRGSGFRAFLRGVARVQRTFKLEIGPLRASGVPAVLLGVTGIILASGVTAALSRGATRLPETLGEARGLAEALNARAPRLKS